MAQEKLDMKSSTYVQKTGVDGSEPSTESFDVVGGILMAVLVGTTTWIIFGIVALSLS